MSRHYLVNLKLVRFVVQTPKIPPNYKDGNLNQCISLNYHYRGLDYNKNCKYKGIENQSDLNHLEIQDFDLKQKTCTKI